METLVQSKTKGWVCSFAMHLKLKLHKCTPSLARTNNCEGENWAYFVSWFYPTKIVNVKCGLITEKFCQYEVSSDHSCQVSVNPPRYWAAPTRLHPVSIYMLQDCSILCIMQCTRAFAVQGSHISFDCRSGLWEDCGEEYKSAYYNIQGCTFQGTICDVQLDAVQIACICANVQTLHCKVCLRWICSVPLKCSSSVRS